MTFVHPELLLWGPAAAFALSFALLVQWRRLSRLGRSYDGPAVGRLVSRPLQGFPTQRMVCLVVACLTLGTAAASPRPTVPEPPEPPPPLDIAVAVDVSLSMSATDVEPSRIERARVVVEALTEALPSARIVLILFADWPYTLVPPTDDPAIVRYFAHSLSADLVLDRDQGTSLSATLAHAREALDARPRAGARRAILVLSDGEGHEDVGTVLEAARSASSDEVPIWTAGIGTPGGAQLDAETGPFLDQGGSPVIARLDEGLLREIATAGRGEYRDVSDDRGLRDLLADLGTLDTPAEGGEGTPLDASFWLTLLALPLLLWEGGLDAGRVGLRPTPRGAEA